MANGARQVAVVTGGTAGAGRAIARRFAREGWRVAVLARGPERLEATRTELEGMGGDALAIQTDTAECEAVFAARDEVMKAWGRIDVWVNCAMATVVSPIRQMTARDYKRVTEVTYLGYVHGTLAALEAMRGPDRGAIIQVGSALSYRAIPLQSAYCACKFAVRGFTDSLRTELMHEGSNIRVCMVQMPGMNTIQFDWARNKLRHKYQPVGEVFQPEVAADAVWRAATASSRELWVGGSAVQAIVGQMIAPSLLDRYLAGTGWTGQIGGIPHDPDDPGNLYEPVPGNQGARGRFDNIAKPRAWICDPERARLWTLGLAGLALVLGWRRRSRRPALPDG